MFSVRYVTLITVCHFIIVEEAFQVCSLLKHSGFLRACNVQQRFGHS